jgi:hypothetical protein
MHVPREQTPRDLPTTVVVRAGASEVGTSPVVASLVHDLRARADAFVFLCGGASKVSDQTRDRLLGLFQAFELLAVRGVRFAVGDGGTRAGIMEAAGLARRASGGAFPLLGVAPAPEILPAGAPGTTPIDPHHSHVVAVDDPGWAEARAATGWTAADGYWGSETGAMYEIFARLAAGRRSVALVANGGAITLDEVAMNLAQNRPLVIVRGSGRAADALVAVLEGQAPEDEEIRRLMPRAAALALPAHRDRIRVFPLGDGPQALADLLATLLGQPAR